MKLESLHKLIKISKTLSLAFSNFSKHWLIQGKSSKSSGSIFGYFTLLNCSLNISSNFKPNCWISKNIIPSEKTSYFF